MRAFAGRLAVALAGLAIATTARSQTVPPQGESGLVLSWEVPAGCPTSAHVLDDLHSLISHRRAPESTTSVSVRALVERHAADRWSVTLFVGPTRRRRIEATTCQQIARATALYVALLLDRSEIGEGPPSDTVPEAPASLSSPGPAPNGARSTPMSNAAPTNRAERGAAAVHRRETSALVATGALIATGTMPRLAPLAALEIGVRYRRVEIALQGATGNSQTTTGNRSGVRLWPVSVTLRPCFSAFAAGRLRLGPCIPVELGWLNAAGTNVAQRQVNAGAWLSLGGELTASCIIGARFEARIGAAVLVPVVRPDLELTGYPQPGPGYRTRTGTVFEPSAGVRAGAAAVFRF